MSPLLLPTNYVVKFGPKRETMKEIIAADPMKEVLHFRATFGPRRETRKEFIEVTSQGNICSNSHSTNYVVKFGPRRETMKALDSSHYIY